MYGNIRLLLSFGVGFVVLNAFNLGALGAIIDYERSVQVQPIFNRVHKEVETPLEHSFAKALLGYGFTKDYFFNWFLAGEGILILTGLPNLLLSWKLLAREKSWHMIATLVIGGVELGTCFLLAFCGVSSFW